VTFWNAFDGTPALLRAGAYDAIILHTTLLCLRWFDTFPMWHDRLSWLRDLDCLKIAMPQDEYDHSEILDGWLRDLGVDHVFSNFGTDVRPLLYPHMAQHATFQHAFTGYIDDQTARELERRLQESGRRPLDVVYRASRLPYWFGSLGQLKHRIGEQAQLAATARGLSADVSTHPDDAIMGDEWFDFLGAGRSVVGCESGSSVLDARGETQKAIRAYLKDHPDATFEEVGAHMPRGWDDHRFAAVSPRHFEAVITRTCQVLVKGRYDGVLEPDRHYLPVRRDLADLGDKLQMASDPVVASEVAERSYEEIYRSGRYSYRVLAELIDGVLATRTPRRGSIASSLSTVAAQLRSPRLQSGAPDREPGWMPAPLEPGVGLIQRRLLIGALGGPVGRGLLRAYLRAGSAKSSISTGALVAECRLLNQVWRAQMAEPRTPGSRAVKAMWDATTLELSVLRRAPNGSQPALPVQKWPPQSIVIRVPSFRAGDSLSSGTRLEAVSALTAIQPRLVHAALRPLLDEIGGARARPGLGGARSRIKTLLALGSVLMEQPRNLSIVAQSIGRAPLWDTADDVVKLSLLRSLKASVRVASQVEPTSGTLRVTTAAEGPDPGGLRISSAIEIKRLVWDNSEVADHVLLPLLGRRMTVYLGAAGVHEFTAIEALPRSARESILRGLES
jgi:hypothetical protein